MDTVVKRKELHHWGRLFPHLQNGGTEVKFLRSIVGQVTVCSQHTLLPNSAATRDTSPSPSRHARLCPTWFPALNLQVTHPHKASIFY